MEGKVSSVLAACGAVYCKGSDISIGNAELSVSEKIRRYLLRYVERCEMNALMKTPQFMYQLRAFSRQSQNADPIEIWIRPNSMGARYAFFNLLKKVNPRGRRLEET
jgi:hypothetical protein